LIWRMKPPSAKAGRGFAFWVLRAGPLDVVSPDVPRASSRDLRLPDAYQRPSATA
jgi:hypothetical protein